MIIVGAGMAGLLCGALNPGSTIFESKPEDQIEHKALFRLRSDRISEFTGIPFKKVSVYKGIWYKNNFAAPNPRITHLYSKKATGRITDRSISNIDVSTRYIPPNDFLHQLKKKTPDIRYDTDFDFTNKKHPIISTIPMPLLSNIMNNVGNHLLNSDCDSKRIFINQFKIKNCNSYSTIYYPDSQITTYRASLNEDILIIESLGEFNPIELTTVLGSFGLHESDIEEHTILNHSQSLGKIVDIDDKLRSDFITAMTIECNIYSLGRFATWRPGLLLDDIVDDIFIIRRLITGGQYAVHKYKQNK
jgi:hypothetical protein